MRERTKALAFVAGWLASLVVLAVAVNTLAPAPSGPSDLAQLRLHVRGPGWTLQYEAQTANATAFALLREAGEVQGFEVRWVEYGWPYDDVFVTSIRGVANDGAANLWWQYCVNGRYADEGASRKVLGSGDTVLWVLAPPGGDDLCV